MATEQTVAELLIDIGVDVDGAQEAAKEIGKVTEAAGKTEKKGGLDLKKFAKDAGKAFAAVGAAAVAAAGAIFKLVDEVTSAGDEVAKAARVAGLGAEEFQRLAFAADRSGASTENVTKASQNFQRFFQEATAKGATPFTEALDRVGLSMDDLADIPFERRLGLIGDALNKVEDESEKVFLAQKLLGEEAGPKLASLLASGTAGITDMGDEAERLGVVLSDDALAASEEFQDQVTNLKATLAGLGNEIGVELIPVVREIIVEVQKWVAENKDLIATKVEAFLRDVVPLLRDFAGAVVTVVEGIVSFTNAIGTENAGAIGALGLLAVGLGGLPGLFAAAGVAAFLAGGRIADAFSNANQRLAALNDEIARLDESRARIKTGRKAVKELDRLAEQGKLGDISSQEYEKLIADLPHDIEGSFLETFDRTRASQREEAATKRALDPTRGILSEAERREIMGLSDEEKKRVVRTGRLPGSGRGRGGGGGGRGKAAAASKEKTAIKPVATLEEFFALSGEEQQGLSGNMFRQERVSEPVKPESVINITNNNFDITQNITGQTDPERIGEAAAAAIREEFDIRLARAGQATNTNVAR